MICPECNQPLEIALMCSGPSGCGGMKAEEKVEWGKDDTVVIRDRDGDKFWIAVREADNLYSARVHLGTGRDYQGVWVFFETLAQAKAAADLLLGTLRAIFGESK